MFFVIRAEAVSDPEFRQITSRMHGSASHAIVCPEESPLLVTVHTSFAVRKSSPEV